ncbi:MAG: sugar transferase [Deltaproteobacteria bacterium]|nr:sugar transferase [Deltaproteobacteria bacterium]
MKRVSTSSPTGIAAIAKRALDLALASSVLLFGAPCWAVIALAVRLTGKTVFFVQPRPGYRGRVFLLYKFRTMVDGTEESEEASRAARTTRIGNLLRRTSLDEIPQLYNVLRGEMSIVGPRPLLVDYLDRYSGNEHRRHDVLPGLTGWAQIHGRNDTTWQERLDRDLWYVDNWSLALDLKIIARTFARLLDGAQPMSEFRKPS